MLSFGQYKKLNENFGGPLGGTFTLGLGKTSVVGGPVGATGIDWEAVKAEEAALELEEAKKCAKKCSKKKMDGDEGEDGELVDPKAPKDADSEDVSDDSDGDDSDDDSDDDSGDSDDGDDSGDSDSGDDGDSGDSGDDGGSGKPPFMKKGMDMKMQSKKSSKKSAKKSAKKMTKEEVDEAAWWKSLKGQVGDFGHELYDDGLPKGTFQEDSLIAPTDANSGLADTESEPAAGEPGFAPQTRIGEMPSYAEWIEHNFSKKN